MNKSNTLEMKKCYTDTLLEVMKENESVIVCDADLANSSGARPLFDAYPDRCVDFGVSESNMAAAAGGLSFTGLKPIIHSFAPFVTRRVVDQVYVSLAFSRANCLIYGSDPGYWSKYNGPTHTTFEDFAIMSSIPEMSVFAPSDHHAFSWVLRHYAENGGLYYVRVPRQAVAEIYSENEHFAYGKGKELYEGDKVAVVATGPELADIMEIHDELADEGIHIGVADLLFIKPLDHELLEKLFHKYEVVIVVENHNIIGGVGQQIAYLAASKNDIGHPVHVRSIGVQDRFGEVGTVDYLKETLHLDKKTIKSTIMLYL